MEVSRDTLCSCGKCHRYFDYSDTEEQTIDLYGIKIKQRVCPHCHSSGFSMVKDEDYLDKFMYTNDLF